MSGANVNYYNIRRNVSNCLCVSISYGNTLLRSIYNCTTASAPSTTGRPGGHAPLPFLCSKKKKGKQREKKKEFQSRNY